MSARLQRECERVAVRARSLRIRGFRWSVEGGAVILAGEAVNPDAIDSVGKLFATTSAREVRNQVRHVESDPGRPGAVRSPEGYVQIMELAQNGSRLAESVVYEVQPGDTLSGIAAAVLGDAARAEAIRQANRSQIGPSDHIHPGQKLRIPMPARRAAAR